LHDLPDRARCGITVRTQWTPPSTARTKLLKEVDFTKDEFLFLVDLADTLRLEKHTDTEVQR